MAKLAVGLGQPRSNANVWIFIIFFAASTSIPAHAQSRLGKFEGGLGTVRYDIDGNLECPTQDDSAEVDSREGVFTDFIRIGVKCASGRGVFNSEAWPTVDVKIDSTYVGFQGDAPADAPFAFEAGSQISFRVRRSLAGPQKGELSYIRDGGSPISIGSWTLSGTEAQEISYSLSQIGIASTVDFRFHAWAASSNVGALEIDNVVLTFAIASSSEETYKYFDDLVVLKPYPNPFESAAVLPLIVGRFGKVRIELFDVLGRRIQVAYDGPLPRGEHRIPIVGRGLPAGTYFIRLATLDRQLVQPVVVTK